VLHSTLGIRMRSRSTLEQHQTGPVVVLALQQR